MGNGCPNPSSGQGVGLPSSGDAQQITQGLRAIPNICSATSQAAEQMLGEPTTLLFSISDFISLELYQVRAFDCLLYTSPSPRD